MKFIFTADIHLKLWNDKSYDEEGIPLKLNEIFTTIRQMCEYARANKLNSIIIGGDLNDTKANVNVRAFVKFNQLLDEYKDLQFYILHGNHDATTADSTNESAVQLISKEHKNAHPIVRPTVLFDRILAVPYSHSILDDVISYPNSTKYPIMISHFGLNEGQMSSGLSIRSSITAASLKQFKLVLLGHYHKPQCIETNSTVFYYVGSPLPMRRDEAAEEKRFLVVDTESLEVESVPTVGYRVYKQFVLNETSDCKEMLVEIEAQRELGNHVVVRSELKMISDDVRTALDGVQIVDAHEDDVIVRGINEGMPEPEKLGKYVEIQGVTEEDRDSYLAIGMECVTMEPVGK